MNRIIYKTDEGGTAVIIPTENAPPTSAFRVSALEPGVVWGDAKYFQLAVFR